MGTAWTVNAEGEVWTIQPQGGGQLMAPAESALQVALGFDGIPWIVTTQRSSGAGNLVQYYAAGSGWQTLPSTIGAVQIAGSTNGFCWIVDENNAIWAVTGTTAPIRQSADGFALTVGVSSVGPAWAVGTEANEQGGGNIIFWYNNANGQWVPVPGAAALQIAGQYDQSAWVVNSDNAIYNVQQNGAAQLMSPAGSAMQVGIGPDNIPWMISTQANNSPGGNEILYYSNGVWTAVPSPASAVQVAGSM